ncbi:MAG: aspartate ammonia-lyase [Bacteroidales bacterium]|nr:aspartate ammonia-lyase [Bacteroidales bacterium]
MATKKYRTESDLLGELKVPAEAYYGVQTQRALNNYKISGIRMCDYPDFVTAIAYVKLAAIQANNELGVIDNTITKAVVKACKEIIDGKMHDNFPIDMLQGGAGTSVNMNANEVIANRALEIMGKERGDYKFCSPNDHINCAQSTNDAYPTALHLTIVMMNKKLVESLKALVASFKAKAKEFDKIIKMGRTQLQDAVPMTLGQEFKAFADTLEEEIENLEYNKKKLYAINMGGTAIGTGINATPGFTKLCCKKLAELTGEPFVAAKNLVAATPDTAGYVGYHGAVKRLAVKLSKVCNDLRLLASGPRCGLGEINLPPKAPGSSIMPGKVNPVIPEVTNQVCFKVIGNDTAVAFAAEAGQLQLNVMEPVIIQCITESITWMSNVMNTLRVECVDGITANADHCIDLVKNSIGIVTALNPYIGYKASTKIAKEAQQTGRSVYDIVLEQKVMTKAKLDEALSPKNMLAPRDYNK